MANNDKRDPPPTPESASRMYEASALLEMAEQAHDDVLQKLINGFPDRVTTDSFRIQIEVDLDGATVISEFTSSRYGYSQAPAPAPHKDLSPNDVVKHLQSKNLDEKLVNVVVDPSMGLLVRKPRKLEDWESFNRALRELGFKWVKYDAQDKANTGLWRLNR